MWDLLIVGTGPAGVSAALTARARGLSFLWFGSRRLSDKIEKAERILNYPGLPRVTGRELRDAFLRQVDDLGIPQSSKRGWRRPTRWAGTMLSAPGRISMKCAA